MNLERKEKKMKQKKRKKGKSKNFLLEIIFKVRRSTFKKVKLLREIENKMHFLAIKWRSIFQINVIKIGIMF